MGHGTLDSPFELDREYCPVIIALTADVTLVEVLKCYGHRMD